MVNKEDLKVSSDLCEEAGMADGAKLLRDLRSRSEHLHRCTSLSDYDDETHYLSDEGFPISLFLSKQAALAESRRRNVQAFTHTNPLAYGSGLSDVCDLDEEKLNERISEIIGNPFSIPELEDQARWDTITPPWPAGLTNEQLEMIFDLFDFKVFDVVETTMEIDI